MFDFKGVCNLDCTHTFVPDVTWGEHVSLPFLQYWEKNPALILWRKNCFDSETITVNSNAHKNKKSALCDSLTMCCAKLERSGATTMLEWFVLCQCVCPSVYTFMLPSQSKLNKQYVPWCRTVGTAHAPLMSIHTGLTVAPLRTLTYSLAHSIFPSCSNWHLVQRQSDRGPPYPAPPEMWPSCQPSNPVQPPPEPCRNSRLLALILTPRGTANNSALVNTTNSMPGGERFARAISLD